MLIRIAPCIVDNDSYLSRINFDIHFVWQVHYLWRYEVDAYSSVYYN